MPNLPAGWQGSAVLIALAVVPATATLAVGNDILRAVLAVVTIAVVGVAVAWWTERSRG